MTNTLDIAATTAVLVWLVVVRIVLIMFRKKLPEIISRQQAGSCNIS